MLTTLYRTSIYTYNYKGRKEILGGMIATFTGNREIGICGCNKLPVGFFIHDCVKDISQPPPIFMTVAVGQGEYITDIYEKGTYEINDLLYCSPNGKITNDLAYRGNVIVGIVNNIEERGVGFITAFSNLEALKFKER